MQVDAPRQGKRFQIDQQTLLVAVLLGCGVALRVVLAWKSPNMIWPDEIFQTLEQAHRLAFGDGIVPWEYREGLRSWVLPGFLAGVMKATAWLGDGSTGYMTAVYVVLSSISVLPALVAYLWAKREFGHWHAVVAMMLPLVWMDLVYFAPKALFGSVAAHLLVPGIYLIYFDEADSKRAIAGWALLALAAVIRLQFAPAVAVVGVILLLGSNRRRGLLIDLLYGAVPVLCFAGVVDWLTWDIPFHSYWMNFKINVLEGKAAQWGESAASSYGVWLFRVSPIATVLFIGCLFTAARRYTAPVAAAATIFLVHSTIGHKEYRFIYGFVVLAAVVSGLELARFAHLCRERWTHAAIKYGVVAVLTVAICAASVFTGRQFTHAKTANGGREELLWQAERGHLLSYRHVSQLEGVCGVGVIGIRWFGSGGFTYLHDKTPLLDIGGARQIGRYQPWVDVVVARKLDELSGYERDRCFDDTCVFVRDGVCEEPPAQMLIDRTP